MPRYVRFFEDLAGRAKNQWKILPLQPDGEVHEIFLDDFRDKHPWVNNSWKVNYLHGLHYDIDLQQMQERRLYKTKVILTTLLNVHKKMVLWSSPARYMSNGEDDVAFYRDFRGFFLPQVWEAIMADGGPEACVPRGTKPTGRALDQAFVNKVDWLMHTNHFDGSDIKFRAWPTPFQLNTWTGWPMVQPSQVAHRIPGRHELRLDTTSIFNQIKVWARPHPDTCPEDW